MHPPLHSLVSSADHPDKRDWQHAAKSFNPQSAFRIPHSGLRHDCRTTRSCLAPHAALIGSIVLAAASTIAAQTPERDPITSAREAIETGDRLFALGKALPACLHYQLAAAVAPEWWYPAYKKALCDMAQGRYRDAFYLLQRAAGSGEGLYVVHLALARWYRANRNPEKAHAEYEAAIAQTRGAVEPMLELADLLEQAGQGGQARLVLQRAEYFAPFNCPVRYRLAALAEKLGFLSEAERHWRFLAANGTNRRRDLVELANFYQRREKPQAARGVLRLLAAGNEADSTLPPPQGPFPDELPDDPEPLPQNP